MYSFEFKKNPDSDNYDFLKVYKNKKYSTLVIIWNDFSGTFSFFDKTSFRNKYTFDKFEDCISAAKAMFDPFQDLLDKINARIELNTKEAKNKMHLRIAEFRGTLFKHGQILKANVIPIDEVPVVGDKVYLHNDNFFPGNSIKSTLDRITKKNRFPKVGKTYTVESVVNMHRGKGITLEEIQIHTIMVDKFGKRTPMNAPFLLSRFEILRNVNR